MTDENSANYTYDFDNRLTKLGNNITYKYDALGRRFQKIVGATTITYYYYQDQLIEEVDNSNNLTEYIYSGIPITAIVSAIGFTFLSRRDKKKSIKFHNATIPYFYE